MKFFALALSATSLAMAVPRAIDAPPHLDHAYAVAPRTHSSWTPAQTIKPNEGGQAADIGFYVNGGDLPDNITDVTDKYLFQLSIYKFEAQRNLRQPDALDWKSDGCTFAPDRPFGYNFLPACHRHDFGLQNYRKQGRLNYTTKRHIDDQFYEDLKHECRTHMSEIVCEKLAWGYYKGAKHFNGPDRNFTRYHS